MKLPITPQRWREYKSLIYTKQFNNKAHWAQDTMAAQQDMAAIIAEGKARLARGELYAKPVKQSKPDEAYSLLVAAKGWCGEGDYESAFVAAYDAVAILEKLADKQRAKRTK